MSTLSELDWEKYGFVMASTWRQRVMKELLKGPTSPRLIASLLKAVPSDVSRHLGHLNAAELATCLNPDASKGRIWGLTQEGRNIAKYLVQRER